MEFSFNDPNFVLKCENFYISYNPHTLNNALGDYLGAITNIPNGQEETALYGPNGVWYILNGDFRQEYLQAAPNGFEACLKVYFRNIKHRSDWSTD